MVPEQQQEGQGPAEKAIMSIQSGFQQLSQLMQQAQGQVDPAAMKLFQSAVQATDAFIQDISGPVQDGAPPQKAQQSGPMPANAKAGAQAVAPNQGY